MKTFIFSKNFPTLLGLLAVIFWSTNVAVTRTLSENLGTFTAAFLIYLTGGALACVQQIATRNFASPNHFPPRYFIVCGCLFAVNLTTFYLAVGFTSGRQQVLEVGLVNYLWPGITLLLSIPILKKKARPWLICGIVMAVMGIVISNSHTFSLAMFWENCKANLFPYIMASIAAISWALYSCYSHSLGSKVKSNPVPLFLLLTALILCIARICHPEQSIWTKRVLWELAYAAIFPTFLAYTCWDISMKKGHVVLVVAFSYFTPLLSTIISSIHLKASMGINLWMGCVLVIAGAVVCKISFYE